MPITMPKLVIIDNAYLSEEFGSEACYKGPLIVRGGWVRKRYCSLLIRFVVLLTYSLESREQRNRLAYSLHEQRNMLEQYVYVLYEYTVYCIQYLLYKVGKQDSEESCHSGIGIDSGLKFPLPFPKSGFRVLS
jgi:hypothetical protein